MVRNLSSIIFRIVGLMLALQSQVASAANVCGEVYSVNQSLNAAPGELTFEMQEALDRSILNLANLRIYLDLVQAKGAGSIARTALVANYKVKEQALVEYLERFEIMTRAQLIERLKQEIGRIQGQKNTEETHNDISKHEESRRRKEHEEKLAELVIDGNRAIMHRIEPGSFKMGGKFRKVDVTLTKSFAMMATPMTQIVWKKIADLANSKLAGKDRINAEPSYFKGDTRPVEQVSFDDVQIWIEALNELSQAGEPSLIEVIPGHKKGDSYRLPTEAEWEFVVRGRGELNQEWPYGNTKEELAEHAWFNQNSRGVTHPVAKKKALVIDGMEFYDFQGNVTEWVSDWYKSELLGGIDPTGAVVEKGSRVLRGGSYNDVSMDLRSDSRDSESPGGHDVSIGFRLVRSIN